MEISMENTNFDYFDQEEVFNQLTFEEKEGVKREILKKLTQNPKENMEYCNLYLKYFNCFPRSDDFYEYGFDKKGAYCEVLCAIHKYQCSVNPRVRFRSPEIIIDFNKMNSGKKRLTVGDEVIQFKSHTLSNKEKHNRLHQKLLECSLEIVGLLEDDEKMVELVREYPCDLTFYLVWKHIKGKNPDDIVIKEALKNDRYRKKVEKFIQQNYDVYLENSIPEMRMVMKALIRRI